MVRSYRLKTENRVNMRLRTGKTLMVMRAADGKFKPTNAMKILHKVLRSRFGHVSPKSMLISKDNARGLTRGGVLHYKRILNSNEREIGLCPEYEYMHQVFKLFQTHHFGAPLLEKVEQGVPYEELNATERQHVDFLDPNAILPFIATNEILMKTLKNVYTPCSEMERALTTYLPKSPSLYPFFRVLKMEPLKQSPELIFMHFLLKTQNNGVFISNFLDVSAAPISAGLVSASPSIIDKIVFECLYDLKTRVKVISIPKRGKYVTIFKLV